MKACSFILIFDKLRSKSVTHCHGIRDLGDTSPCWPDITWLPRLSLSKYFPPSFERNANSNNNEFWVQSQLRFLSPNCPAMFSISGLLPLLLPFLSDHVLVQDVAQISHYWHLGQAVFSWKALSVLTHHFWKGLPSGNALDLTSDFSESSCLSFNSNNSSSGVTIRSRDKISNLSLSAGLRHEH